MDDGLALIWPNVLGPSWPNVEPELAHHAHVELEPPGHRPVSLHNALLPATPKQLKSILRCLEYPHPPLSDLGVLFESIAT